MPRNVEIKARVPSLSPFAERLQALGAEDRGVLHQVDVFYQVGPGEEPQPLRLKLRTMHGAQAELILYARPDQAGPKTSDYLRTPVPDPATMHELLSRLLGVRGQVCKTRRLWLQGQTRVHLDCVEGLGEFVELEVLLRDDQDEGEGVAVARELMHRLGIPEEALVEGAYVDLRPNLP
jgi:predicted adenylyl cyclase CyaB